MSFYVVWRFKDRFNLSTRDLFIGWGIKIVYSISFILIFSHFYSNGNLYGDASNFIKDSALLRNFAAEHPGDYLKLLFGFGNEESFFKNEILAQTSIWSAGENGDFINDNHLIIRINSIIHFFSGGNIYVHGLLLSFLSFFGLLLIYKSFERFIANKRLFYFILIAFPSIGFWGSGITKEALLLVGLGLFFYSLIKIGQKRSTRNFLILMIGIALLLFNKPHVGLIVLSLSPFLFIGKLTNWTKKGLYLFPISLVLIVISLTYTPSEINLLDKISYKQKDLINMGKGGVFFVTDSTFCAFDYTLLDHFETVSPDSIRVLKVSIGEAKLFGNHPFKPFQIEPSAKNYAVYLIQPPSGSYLPTDPINYSRSKLFQAIPVVLANTIVRPFPGDEGSLLKYAAMASNFSFLLFIAYVLFNRKKLTLKEKYFGMYLLTSALVILLIIGWTTPILGAIARYKMAAELLIFIFLSILLKPLKNA